MITVAQLIAHLQTFDPNLPVIYERYSDFDWMELNQVHQTNAVNKDWYIMRSHPTMSEEDKNKMISAIIFPGN